MDEECEVLQKPMHDYRIMWKKYKSDVLLLSVIAIVEWVYRFVHFFKTNVLACSDPLEVRWLACLILSRT